MATKSFLKDINITDKKSATSFIQELENAEKKGRKKVSFNKNVETIKDKNKIREIFKK